MGAFLPAVDRLVELLTHHRATTRYAVLADTAARVRAGSLEHALPGLAQLLAEGTGAQRAVVWLGVEGELIEAAAYPRRPPGEPPDVVANLAVLLARPDTGYVVPVLDGSVLRAALAIGKPGAVITPEDLQLVRDVAAGAGLLLRSVQSGVELRERVRRADELAEELAESRRRLTAARNLERRRLVGELAHATTSRLGALRRQLSILDAALAGEPDGDESWPEASAQTALTRARAGLDELLERFRAIARGVYPAVLRDQGPTQALDEMATDLPRPVRLTGRLARRLSWEVESGVYFVAAAAVQQLASAPGPGEVHVHFEHEAGRLAVRVEDRLLDGSGVAALRDSLVGEVERLRALGGSVQIDEESGLMLHASLPDGLEPLVSQLTAESGSGS